MPAHAQMPNPRDLFEQGQSPHEGQDDASLKNHPGLTEKKKEFPGPGPGPGKWHTKPRPVFHGPGELGAAESPHDHYND